MSDCDVNFVKINSPLCCYIVGQSRIADYFPVVEKVPCAFNYMRTFTPFVSGVSKLVKKNTQSFVSDFY